MKKWFFQAFFIISILLALVLVADFAAPAPKPALGLPEVVVISTPKVGGKHHTMGVALSDTLQKALGVKVIVQPTEGTAAKYMLVMERKAHMVFASSADAQGSFRGERVFEKIGATRFNLLVNLSSAYEAIVVDSRKVKSWSDLRGKALYADDTANVDKKLTTEAMLLAEGLKPGVDVKLLKFASKDELIDGVKQGVAVGAYTAVPTAASIELDAVLGGKSKVLSISSLDKAAKIREIYPSSIAAYPRTDISYFPKGTITVTKDEYLVVAPECSEQLAYLVTRYIIENAAELASKHSPFQDISLERLEIWPELPYHPGAIKYYKEKGIWTKEIERLHKELLAEQDKALAKPK